MQILSFLIFTLTFLAVPFFFNSCESGFQEGSKNQVSATPLTPQEVLGTFCKAPSSQSKITSKVGRYRQVAKVNLEDLSHEHTAIVNGEEFYVLNITASNKCILETQTGFVRSQFLDQVIEELEIQSYRYDLETATSLDSFAELMESDPCILRVSPNRKLQFASTKDTLELASYAYPTPNDPFYMDQKHLTAIEAQAGFSILYNPTLSGGYSSNAKPVLVGIVDSGADWSHPDLKGNLWNFTVTQSGTGIVEGPFYGVNATSLDPLISSYEDYNPVDLVGHGTHLAGLVAAVSNNSRGVTGLGPSGIKIMTVKIFGPKVGSSTETLYSSAVFNGSRWAAKKGAKILNMSFGYQTSGSSRDIDFEILFDELMADGVVVIVATGNGSGASPRQKIDNVHFAVMPAIYGASYEGVINVGASQAETKLLASFSHYGEDYVEIAAPGTQLNSGGLPSGLFSTFPVGLGSKTGYDVLSGTSQSAPLVAAAAAHVMRYVKNATGTYPQPCMVEGILKYGSEKSELLKTQIEEGNHLNLRILGEKLRFLFEAP